MAVCSLEPVQCKSSRTERNLWLLNNIYFRMSYIMTPILVKWMKVVILHSFIIFWFQLANRKAENSGPKSLPPLKMVVPVVLLTGGNRTEDQQEEFPQYGLLKMKTKELHIQKRESAAVSEENFRASCSWRRWQDCTTATKRSGTVRFQILGNPNKSSLQLQGQGARPKAKPRPGQGEDCATRITDSDIMRKQQQGQGSQLIQLPSFSKSYFVFAFGLCHVCHLLQILWHYASLGFLLSSLSCNFVSKFILCSWCYC